MSGKYSGEQSLMADLLHESATSLLDTVSSELTSKDVINSWEQNIRQMLELEPYAKIDSYIFENLPPETAFEIIKYSLSTILRYPEKSRFKLSRYGFSIPIYELLDSILFKTQMQNYQETSEITELRTTIGYQLLDLFKINIYDLNPHNAAYSLSYAILFFLDIPEIYQEISQILENKYLLAFLIKNQAIEHLLISHVLPVTFASINNPKYAPARQYIEDILKDPAHPLFSYIKTQIQAIIKNDHKNSRMYKVWLKRIGLLDILAEKE